MSQISVLVPAMTARIQLKVTIHSRHPLAGSILYIKGQWQVCLCFVLETNVHSRYVTVSVAYQGQHLMALDTRPRSARDTFRHQST